MRSFSGQNLMLRSTRNGPHVQFMTLPTYQENGEINKETFLPFMTNLLTQFGFGEETAKSILEERIKNNEDAKISN